MKKPILKFWRSRYSRLTACATLILLAVFLVPQTAAAANNPQVDEIYRNIVSLLDVVMELLNRIIWPVLLLIGGLLNNNILFGAGMEQRVLGIWVEIRNFVNVLFVLLLLAIALYNVVGGSNQSFQLKQVLPRFVIALIAVNFSYLAVKLVVDTVNVVSTALFALPVTISDQVGKFPVDEQGFINDICTGIYGDDPVKAIQRQKASEEQAAGSSLCTPVPPDSSKPDEVIGADQLITWKFTSDDVKSFFTQFDSGNAAMIMALQLQQIHEINKVTTIQPTLQGLLSNMMFSLIMYIIYATAFVALFVVLLVRLVELWVMMVLSPLIVLTYALPDNIKGLLGTGDEMKKKFFKAAFVPVPIAMMLSIGFIMLKGVATGNFQVTGVGTSTASLGVQTSGLNTFQFLIAAIGTAAVVWEGVFMAAKGTYAEGAVNKIKGFVEGVGKFAVSSIKYAPLFPVYVPGDKQGELKAVPQSLASMQAIWEGAEDARRTKAREQAQAAMPWMTGGELSKLGAAIKGSKSYEEWQQNMTNAKAAGKLDSPDLQKDIATSLQNNSQIKANLKIPVKMLEADGKTEIKGKDKLIEALKQGKVHADTMKQIAELNQGTKVPQAEPSKPGEESKGQPAPAIDHAAAKGKLDMAGPYEQAVIDAEKDTAKRQAMRSAIDGYRTEMGKNKNAAKADEALKALAATGVVDSLGALEAEGRDTARSAAATPADRMQQLIDDRKKQLDGHGITDEKAVKKILRREFDGAFKDPAKKAVLEKNGILESEAIEKQEPVSTAAIEEPAKPGAAAPAAGAKPGTAPPTKKDEFEM